jgi:hypothetical protein
VRYGDVNGHVSEGLCESVAGCYWHSFIGGVSTDRVCGLLGVGSGYVGGRWAVSGERSAKSRSESL